MTQQPPQPPRLNKPGTRPPQPPEARAIAPAKPSPPPTPHGPNVGPKQPHPLARFVGTRAVVTTLGGQIIEGDAVELRDGTMTFTNCRIVGSKAVATVDTLVLFLRVTVAHMTSMPTSLTPVEPKDILERCEP